MKSAIEEIYLGEACDFKQTKSSEVYSVLIGMVNDLLRGLKKDLNEVQFQIVKNLHDILYKMAEEMGKEHYKAGFKRGLRLGFELSE